ncbi:MAG: aldo/keto reductase [Acidobacteriaceae bacterium]
MPMTSDSQQAPAETVGSNLVPQRTLYTDAKMPAIGLGTFGSDHVSHQVVAETVLAAAEVGYRHFDCASVYGNEDLIGLSFQKILRGVVERKHLWSRQ